MNESLLTENLKKRQDKPLWLLVCFAMFSFWQMGFIYFVGPSLTIDGKTLCPLIWTTQPHLLQYAMY